MRADWVDAFGPSGSVGQFSPPDRHMAHMRHRIDRRAFLGGALAGGAVLGSTLFTPAAAAKKQDATPKPTTNVISLNGIDFSLTIYGPGLDPSVITDFNGIVGVAQVQGTGTGRNPDGSTEDLLFDTDMRFMKGTYVGQDGLMHDGAFAFV